MKSKRNQYLLLTLVLIIWGLIVYRFFNMTDAVDSDPVPIKVSKNATDESPKSKYVYQLNYRDPFLKISSPRYRTQPSERDKPMASHHANIPNVRLVGLVSSGNKKTAIVQIGTTTHMVKNGDHVEGFDILLLSEEDVTIRYVLLDSAFILGRVAK